MINVDNLATELAQGRQPIVVYRPSGGGRVEYGKVTSLNERYVFVRYEGDTGSKATNPEDLTLMFRDGLAKCPCIEEGGPVVTCLYHGDTTRLAGGKVLPWPEEWPIPRWDTGHRNLRGDIVLYGNYHGMGHVMIHGDRQ